MTLLSKGSYGCIYYPIVRCTGKQSNNTKYVSKLQENNFASKNELYISNIIKTNILNYGNMFSVIIRSCPINYKEIKDKEIKACPLIDKDNDIIIESSNNEYPPKDYYYNNKFIIIYYY